MTCADSNGTSVGYQLAKYQFFDGMVVEDIKNRIEKFKREEFSEDENKVIDFFLKAYVDNFQEKRYYNIEDLSILNDE